MLLHKMDHASSTIPILLVKFIMGLLYGFADGACTIPTHKEYHGHYLRSCMQVCSGIWTILNFEAEALH